MDNMKKSHPMRSWVAMLLLFWGCFVILGLLAFLGPCISWGANCSTYLSGSYVSGVGFHNGKVMTGTSNHPIKTTALDGSGWGSYNYVKTLGCTASDAGMWTNEDHSGGAWVYYGQIYIWTVPNTGYLCNVIEPPGYCQFQCTFQNVSDPASGYDYDCDGVPDATDSDPASVGPADADGDGVPDDVDPWPNDPTKPGNLTIPRWKKGIEYVRKSDGGILTYWKDTVGTNNFYSWGGTGDAPVGPYSLSEWDVLITPGSDANTYSWNDLFPGGANPGNIDGNNEKGKIDSGSGEIVAALKEMGLDLSGGGYGGGKGLSDVYNALVGLGLGGGIKGAVTDLGTGLGSKLDAIKGAIEGQSGLSMTGVESRVDSTNSKLDTVVTKLQTNNDRMDEMLANGDMPDAELSGVQDNSSVSDDVLGGRLESEKGILTSFFDSWWASNPVKSIVSGSGIEASGDSSFVISTATFGETTIDLSGLSGGLEAMGIILVGLAGLGGLVVVLRG